MRDRPQEAAAPLLLLHGFTGSAEAWGDTILDGLAAERRVLAVDLPGHGGRSVRDRPLRPPGGRPRDRPLRRPGGRPLDRPARAGGPVPEGGFSLPATVDFLVRGLDERHVERAVWVGYSMGGRIALGAAVLRPERVAALVLESASPGLATEDERARRRVLDEARARRLEQEGLEAWVDAWMDLPIFRTQRTLPPEARARERARRLRHSTEGLSRVLRELGTGSQPSFWERLPEVDADVLLLTGELDRKFCRIADAMADRLPSVRRKTVPGVGHAVHLEAPDRWLAAVRNFLGDAPTVPAERT